MFLTQTNHTFHTKERENVWVQTSMLWVETSMLWVETSMLWVFL